MYKQIVTTMISEVISAGKGVGGFTFDQEGGLTLQRSRDRELEAQFSVGRDG